MTEAMTKLKEAKEAIAAATEAAKSVARTAAEDAAKALFAAFPELEAFRWEQYTPYFNDGDSCTFSVRDVRAKFVNGGCTGDNEDGWVAVWNRGESDDHRRAIVSAQEIVNELGKDMLEHLFGDHVEVTCTRAGGGVFTTDECSHD